MSNDHAAQGPMLEVYQVVNLKNDVVLALYPTNQSGKIGITCFVNKLHKTHFTEMLSCMIWHARFIEIVNQAVSACQQSDFTRIPHYE